MKGYAKTYRCVNCNAVINAMRNYKCPYCNRVQPLEGRAESLGDKIVDIECPSCGFSKSFFRTSQYADSAYCPKCGKTTYENTDGKKPYPTYAPITPKPTVECPYCHSKDTKKISGISKAGSIAVFGIFAMGKATKQWHCNNCKSDF